MNCIDTAAGPSYSSREVLSVVRRCLPFEVPEALRDQHAMQYFGNVYIKVCVRSFINGVGS